MENFSWYVVKLYDNVLYEQKTLFPVDQLDVRKAVENMKQAYLPQGNWQIRKQVPIIANYDDVAHQCAYLHKYAMCYSGVVNYFMRAALTESDILVAFLGEKDIINVCSLGGGPGTDAVAISEAFVQHFSFSRINICVVDYFEKWEKVFTSVIKELQTELYGSATESVLTEYFKCEFIQANLLESFSPCVKQAIRNSDFVSMVKFISAAACCKTETMVKEVFTCMQPGAFLLFIDNAAGGFLEMVQKVAGTCGMLRIFGPITHFTYRNDAYCVSRYGYKSQSKTKISVQIWMKSLGKLDSKCEILVDPQLVSHSYHKSRGKGGEFHEPAEHLQAECKILVEPELVVHSYQHSHAKGELTQEPPRQLKTEFEILVKPELDSYSYQNSHGRDIGSRKPARLPKAESEILVEPELDSYSYQNSSGRNIGSQKQSRALKAKSGNLVEPELDLYSYQNSLGRDIGSQKQLRALKAESGNLVEPELDFYSYRNSPGRDIESQKPSGTLKTESGILVEPKLDFYSYQSSFDSDLYSERPWLITPPPGIEDNVDAPHVAENKHSVKSGEDEKACCCIII